MFLKVPHFFVWRRVAVPNEQRAADLFFECVYLPMADRMSYVWLRSGFFLPSSGRPAFGMVHRGKFWCSDGLALYYGEYLPGPTEAGVAVTFLIAPPRLTPSEYCSDVL